jgi:hypothetical protein
VPTRVAEDSLGVARCGWEAVRDRLSVVPKKPIYFREDQHRTSAMSRMAARVSANSVAASIRPPYAPAPIRPSRSRAGTGATEVQTLGASASTSKVAEGICSLRTRL